MAEFKIGDRVGVLPDYGPVGDDDVSPDDLFGTICLLHPNGLDYGIKFDRDVGGHTCLGTCAYGRGWFIGPSYLFHETEISSIPAEAILEVLSNG